MRTIDKNCNKLLFFLKDCEFRIIIRDHRTAVPCIDVHGTGCQRPAKPHRKIYQLLAFFTILESTLESSYHQ